jgi:hypothetical protein
MSKWNELSLEIITTIFRNFQSGSRLISNTEELQQCALTCPNWRHVAQLMMFSNITVESTRQFLQLCRVLTTSPTFKAMVKYLKVASLIVLLNLNTFELMADIFPNIETLEFGDIIRSYNYFYELVCNDRYPSLTHIPAPWEPGQHKVYFECLEKKKKSINSIALLGDGGYEY